MTSPRRTALAALILLAAGAPAGAAEFWEKAWTIAEVDGDADQRATLQPAMGRAIVLTPERIVDPLSRDCQKGADLSDIRSRPVGQLDRHFGALWKWPQFKHSREVYGWARCEGSNIGAFAFVSPDEAYLFYEDGVIVRLR